MNDRVSAKPPSIYTQEEAAMEHYHQTSSRGLNSHVSSELDGDKAYYDAGIESTKPSGMYRFGKALASAFNPVNVWQGINGIWRDKEQHTPSEKGLLEARKARAEKAYAEMKRNGFQGTQPFSTRTANINQSQMNSRRGQSDSVDSSLRSSDVTVGHPCALALIEHGRPTPAGSEDLLIPSTVTESRPPPPSPVTQGKNGRKTSIDLRRPSFQSLKKVRSQIQLPSTKRKLTEAALFPHSDAVSTQTSAQGLKREPSKKDITKQRKLSKQVSDLESKLEATRRELQLCTGEIPKVPEIPRPGRSVFQPGALPFLPSESDMKPITSSAQDKSNLDWQPTSRCKQSSTPRKRASNMTTVKTPMTAEQRKAAGQDSEITSSGKRRKSSSSRTADHSYLPRRNTDNGSDSDVSVSAKKVPRARKSHKFDAPHGKEATPQGPSHSVSKKPVSVPPVLKVAAPFDPTKVDKHKLLAMRSVPKDDLPFGSHLDDIVNLQKEFPHCSQKQLDEYLSSLPKDPKAKEQPGDVDAQNPTTSLSQKSGAASSAKASKSSDVSANPRQACGDSSPKRKMARELSTIDEAITVDPSKDSSIPPVPTTFIMKTHGKHADKPLPKIQKENYEWPEDVF